MKLARVLFGLTLAVPAVLSNAMSAGAAPRRPG